MEQRETLVSAFVLIYSFLVFVLWHSLYWPNVPTYCVFITLADGHPWKTRKPLHGLIQCLHGNLSHHAQYSKNCQGTHWTTKKVFHTHAYNINTCMYKEGMWVSVLKELILQKWKCLWNYMCVLFIFLFKENECLKRELLEKGSCIEKQNCTITELITQNQRWVRVCQVENIKKK